MIGRSNFNRRSTRNKTVVFTPEDLKEEVEDCNIKRLDSPDFFNSLSPESKQTGFIQTRSYNFKELVSAFHSIEKRAMHEPSFVKEALKRFKTNEENAIENNQSEEIRIINAELFPKIMNNPFLHNENDISFRRIEKNYNPNKFPKK